MFVFLHCDYHNFIYNDVISTAAITVQFLDDEYTVEEGGTTNDEFTLVLSGAADREIEVTLTGSGDTGKPLYTLPMDCKTTFAPI